MSALHSVEFKVTLPYTEVRRLLTPKHLTRAGHLILNMNQERLELIQLLLARLERISVDSYWAHRASGVRGALIRIMEEFDAQQPLNQQTLESLSNIGFQILEKAAKEKH